MLASKRQSTGVDGERIAKGVLGIVGNALDIAKTAEPLLEGFLSGSGNDAPADGEGSGGSSFPQVQQRRTTATSKPQESSFPMAQQWGHGASPCAPPAPQMQLPAGVDSNTANLLWAWYYSGYAAGRLDALRGTVT